MAYGTPTELARRLKIANPSAAQTEALQLALDAAASEIDWELSGSPSWTPPPTEPPYPPLVVEVNYERAVEHWQQGQMPGGIVGLGGDAIPIVLPRNTWYRHHVKLLPLKGSGVAAEGEIATPFGIA